MNRIAEWASSEEGRAAIQRIAAEAEEASRELARVRQVSAETIRQPMTT